MVGLHFLNRKVLAAFRTDTFLSFIGSACHFRGKGTNAQMLFVAVKQVFINAFLVGNILVIKQFNNTLFVCFRVMWGGTVLVVIDTPVKPGHQLFAEIGERSLHPTDNGLKIQPQFIAVRVVLML